MSCSPKEAICERHDEIHQALDTRDSEALYRLAALEEEGNDEEAEVLRNHARRIDQEDMSYDQARDNGEI